MGQAAGGRQQEVIACVNAEDADRTLARCACKRTQMCPCLQMIHPVTLLAGVRCCQPSGRGSWAWCGTLRLGRGGLAAWQAPRCMRACVCAHACMHGCMREHTELEGAALESISYHVQQQHITPSSQQQLPHATAF